jgi:glycosyltransferase involved in cell wall biosynthesis
VIAHSSLAAAAFVGAGVPSDRCVTAHNGHAPALMQPERSAAAARQMLGLPGGALLVYTGHAGPHKGTDALIQLAACVPDATVVIVGVDEDGPDCAWVSDRVRSAGVRNVRLVPRVALVDVAVYMYAADCLVIPPTQAPLTRYGRTVLPMKLFSYMAAGRPILAPRLPDIEEVLEDGVTALLVPPDNPVAAANAVRRVLTDSYLAERLSATARQQSGGYTWAARAQTLAVTLDHWRKP